MSHWRLLNRSEIEDQKWNEMIAIASNEHIYGYTYYLDIVSSNWKGLIFGNYEALMPVSLKSKFGVKYLGQINHIQRLNTFTNLSFIPSVNELERLLLASVSYIDFVTQKKIFLSLSCAERVNLILPLNQTHDALRKFFKTNTQRGIKKAQKSGAYFKESNKNSIVEAIELFQSQKNYGLSKVWFQELKLISVADFAEIYAIELKGENVAFAMVLVSEKRVTLIFTALGEKGKEIGAMPLLISELINKFSNSNKTFDFEGSDNAGTARFYSSFGAIAEKYYHYQSDGILKRTKELLKGK
jgi:hypothetical protein|tara:strand:+ start:24 stop:920 length:897 start_codon:yes stop_codon:yes gene_type:complete